MLVLHHKLHHYRPRVFCPEVPLLWLDIPVQSEGYLADAEKMREYSGRLPGYAHDATGLGPPGDLVGQRVNH
jgi:hypothetical protein